MNSGLGNKSSNTSKPLQRVRADKWTTIFAGFLLFTLLACRSWLAESPPTPTPAPLVLSFAVSGPKAVVDDAPPTPIPLQLTPVTKRPTDTPEPRPTSTPTAPPPPLAPIAPPVQAPAAPPTAAPQAQPPTGGNIYNGPPSPFITLRGPASGYQLPPGQDQLEFEWHWAGPEPRPCHLPEGHSFEVRLWPDPNQPSLGGAVVPQGVIDAVEVKDVIAASCDPRFGTRRFTVTYLHKTPAVQQAGGSGQIFWDVAYIQLEPYYVVVGVSPLASFFIAPPPADQPTLTPTPTVTPLYIPQPPPRPAGNITLLAPASGAVFGADVGPVEFKWSWDGPLLADKCQPAEGYGFEIRIGSLDPGLPLLGAMDAVKDQEKVGCDREAGAFNFTVQDIKQAPGIKATYVDNFRWDGRFRWDVALVSLNPYLPPTAASAPETFEISLAQYAGPVDPFGEPLKCSIFGSWIEAQAVFLAAGGPNRDPHRFDLDANGIACDELRR